MLCVHDLRWLVFLRVVGLLRDALLELTRLELCHSLGVHRALGVLVPMPFGTTGTTRGVVLADLDRCIYIMSFIRLIWFLRGFLLLRLVVVAFLNCRALFILFNLLISVL